MDSDEFDGDDIADEDLIVAATQATTPTRAVSSSHFNNNNRVQFQPGVRASTSTSSASFGGLGSRQPRSMVS